MSITDTLKLRLVQDRPMTSITLRISAGGVESLKPLRPSESLADTRRF